jgi:hypothetical protein
VETESVHDSNALEENTVTRPARPSVLFLLITLWFATTVAAAEWPMLSESDINVWANTLRPYKVTRVGITYNKRDKDVAVAINKAMQQAGWRTPTLGDGVEGPVGTGIADSPSSAQAAAALQALFEKQFGVRPEIKQYVARDSFIELYVGRPADR